MGPPPFSRSDADRPVAMVTGGSAGLGREFADALARAGHDLVIHGRDRDVLDALACDLGRRYGASCLVIAGDLTDDRACDDACAAIDAAGRGIDLLINNAGFGIYGPFAQSDSVEQISMIRLNVIALTRLTRHVLPGMIARGRGRIMHVASVAAFMPGPLLAVYYATKSYVLHFSEALACECRGTGVTITAFCPGPTATGFQRRARIEGARFVRGRTFPSAAAVAAEGISAMMAGRSVAISGFANRLLVFWLRFLPRVLVRTLVHRAQAPT